MGFKYAHYNTFLFKRNNGTYQIINLTFFDMSEL